MKKVLFITGLVLLLLFGGLLVVPVIFKDDIQKAVKEALDGHLQAEIIFDVDKMSLSLLRSFPHISVEWQALGIIGQDSFAGDTLLWVEAFGVSLDLGSVISGRYKIRSLYLEQPKIQVQVTNSGVASYNIMKPTAEDDSSAEVSQDSVSFALEVDMWRVEQAELSYVDSSAQFYTHIEGLDFRGSGNFNQDIFDLDAEINIARLQLAQEGVSYFSGPSLSGVFTIEVNNLEQRYTLQENRFQVGDFVLELEGTVRMQEEVPQMDLRFSSPQTGIKELLSLLPTAYMKDFEAWKAAGVLSFEGSIQGSYTEEVLPSFSLLLEVKDGKMSHPELPKSIDQLEIILKVEHPEGPWEETRVEIPNLYISVGENVLKGEIYVENLRDYMHKAQLSLGMDLEEVLEMAPQEDITLQGRCDMEIQTAGRYDSHTFPTLEVDLRLSEGYAKHKDYDIPVERIGLHARVRNATGRRADTELHIDPCELWIEGKRFASTLLLRDLEHYNWDFSVEGSLDLAKLTQVFPVEGTEIAGLVAVNIRSQGQYADVEAQRYEAIQVQGSATVQAFRYSSEDLPQPFGVSRAQLDFSTEALKLKQLVAQFGNTELHARGALRNYIGYALREGEVLRGHLELRSPKIIVSELLTEEKSSPAGSTAPAPEPTLLPAHMDIRMRADIQEVLYDQLQITQLQGDISLKDRVASLDNLAFMLLGGQFSLTGSYHTPPKEAPRYDMSLNIQQLDIQKAYASIEMLQKMAPVAKDLRGLFSTQSELRGALSRDLNPIYESVHGTAKVQIQESSLKAGPAAQQLAGALKMPQAGDSWPIQDLEVSVEIIEGHMYVKPFTVSQGAYPLTISGNNSLRGEIDYTIETSVATRTLAAHAGIFVPEDLSIELPQYTPIGLRMQGAYDSPKVSMSRNTFDLLKKQVQEAVQKALKKQAQESMKKEMQKKAEEAKKKLKGLFGN